MQALELKIPPPIVGLLVATAMWAVSQVPPTLALPSSAKLALTALCVVAGLAFDLLGLVAFRRAHTTINPLSPNRASALVSGGVYRITRNPMYVGLAFLLSAWAVYLSAVWPFVGPVIFVLYISRFQIQPEERILKDLFGEAYADYVRRVRRWL